MGRAGHYKFLVTFINDSYVGFDQSIPFQFKVIDDPEDKEMLEYTYEDQAAVKGGGMLQQMMQMEEESSEEEATEDTSSGKPGEQLDEMEKLRRRLKDAGMEDALEEDK